MKLHKISRIPVLLACAAMFAWSGCSQASTDSTGGSKASSPPASSAAKKVEVKVGAGGYEPEMVMAKAGVPLTIVFTRTTDKGCGQKVLIPSENVEKDLPLNTPVEVTFTPAKSGNISFTCGMKMLKGTIMVH